MTPAATDSLMADLKHATQAAHVATEHQPFQRALVDGSLPRDAYLALLAQVRPIHAALEDRLWRAAATCEPIRLVLHDDQRCTPHIDADLNHLAPRTEHPAPLPATQRLLDAIDASAGADPVALLGWHYVFEGAKNGGRYIARSVRAAYALPPDAGTRYLDPYGNEQRLRWQAFKDAMDRLNLSPAQRAAILDAASTAFDMIGGVHAELHQRMIQTAG